MVRNPRGPCPDPSPAQRDGEVEDRQHERARVLGEEVADDGGRNGGVAGLADAHQPAGEDQQPEVLWGRGAGCWETVLLLCLLILGPRFAPHPLRGPGARMEPNHCLSNNYTPGLSRPQLLPLNSGSDWAQDWDGAGHSQAESCRCGRSNSLSPLPAPPIRSLLPWVLAPPREPQARRTLSPIPDRAAGLTLAALRTQCTRGVGKASPVGSAPLPHHTSKSRAQLSREGWGPASCQWSYPL